MLPVYTTVAAVYQTESTASSSLLEVDELGRVVNLSPTIKNAVLRSMRSHLGSSSNDVCVNDGC